MEHEQIAKRFLESKAVDFGNMGKFVAELGPTLAVEDSGLHGVLLGRFNILACMLRPLDAERLIGSLGAASQIAAAAKGQISRG